MRRAILAVLVTAIGLVLLLSFKPHEVTALAGRPSAVSQREGSVGGGDSRVLDGGQAPSGGDDHDRDGDGDGDGDDSGRPEHGDLEGGTQSGALGGQGNGRSGQGSGQGSGQVSTRAGGWAGTGGTAGATSGDKVVTGEAADTRWGPVQVELVLSGGKVTGVKVLRAPSGNHRDVSINNRALPILNEEALSAQSAQIDVVSGATYTSEGYARSLQSALDKAGL